MSFFQYFDEDAQDAVGAILSGGDKVSVTYDDGNNTLTIDTSALDTEEVEDAVNTLLSAGNAISFTYDDASDTLTIDVDESGISLSNLGSLDAGSQKITSVNDPDNAQDVATKNYTDGVAQGLDIKDSVRASTNGTSIDLTSTTDPNPIDGVTLSDGDRVLLKDQSTTSENGIYLANTATDPTTWTRASDFDEDDEVTAGAFTFVEEGTANQDTGWVVTSDDPIAVGTDAIVFSQFTGAGDITAGDGLTKSGDTLNVNVDGTTIEVSSDQLQIVTGGVGSNEIDETDNYTWTGQNDFQGQTNIDDKLTKDIQTVTSNTTLTGSTANTTLVDASGGAVTITLPSSPEDGLLLTVKKTDSSSNDVTVDGNGNNVDGSGSYTISRQYDSITVQYDGTSGNWYII